MFRLKNTVLILLTILSVQSFSQSAFDDKPIGSYELNLAVPELVNAFYELNNQKLFWFTPGENSLPLRQQLKNIIENADKKGLDKDRYHYQEVAGIIETIYAEKDSLEAMRSDRILTDAAISYLKDLHGYNISKWIMYDEISEKYRKSENSEMLKQLNSCKTATQLGVFFSSREPRHHEYYFLLDELAKQKDLNDKIKLRQLNHALNIYRWIHHFNFNKFIVVNAGSATLRYYERDSLITRMKVVVGKPSTKTPRFAAYCNQVILYPYWNVPASIALNELLPKFKRNPHHIDDLNMQLIDSKGKVVNPYRLNWKSFGRNNFPYRMRQSTGCDNSLGVIKFNLTSPFSVYLHDTNNKSVFLSSSRYFSHGCIRLEKPIELGNILLNNRIDKKFLESCLNGQQPVINDIQPVPVFVVYSTAELGGQDVIQYFKDTYGLLK